MAAPTLSRIAGLAFLAVVLAASAPRDVLSQDDLQTDLPSLDISEAPSIRIDNIGLADGIAQGTVNNLMQDSKGFIWFGTQAGLHRYDGHKFEVYEPVPFDTTSIINGWVWDITETSDGSIWASTVDGLSRLDQTTGRFENFVHDPEDSTSISGGFVFASLEASDGTMWIATNDGLDRMDPDRSGVFERFDHVHDDSTTLAGSAYFLHEGPDGFIWVSTADGLARFDPDTAERTDYFRTGEHRGASAPQAFLGSMPDPQDPRVLWFGTGRGLARFDTRTGQREDWVPYPDEPPFSDRNVIVTVAIDPGDDRVRWLGTSGGGLLRFDTRTEKFSHYTHDPKDPNSLASNMASMVFADRSGTMWVGYGNKGLGKFSPSSVNIAHLRHDPDAVDNTLAPGNIWAIKEAGGRLWVSNSTDAGDDILTRYDLGSGEVTRLQADEDDASTFWPGTIQSILLSQDGRLWVGSSGLSWCDPDTLECQRLPRARGDSTKLAWAATHALFEAPDEPGVIWSGTFFGGLQRYDSRTGEVTRYPTSATDSTANPYTITHIILGSDDALWMGSADAGLIRFDRESETFRRFSYDAADTTGVAANHMEVVLERPMEPGILWLASLGSGIDKFDMDSGKVVRHYTTEDGLANNTMYGMLQDNTGLLWVSTNRGISSFDPKTETFRNYGLDDGLRELEFMQNAFSNGRGGMLYFGDVSGITAFVPSLLGTNSTEPEVAFSQLRVEGDVVRPEPGGILETALADSASIELPYSKNSFSVDFVALHFSNPTRNRYSYYLEGYDDDWIDGGVQRTASYTNLPPGDYTMHVRAANPDGVWNEQGIALGVDVLPPWYRTTWAYILFAVLLGAAIFGGDRYQRRRLLKRERARAELQEIELRAEAAESEAKALAAENQRKKNIERLSDIGQEITASLDFETIFHRVYVHINELTDAPIFGVGVWRPDRNLIDYRLAIEEGKKYEPYTRDTSDKNQFPVWCIEHKEAVFINDVESEYSKYIEHYDEQGATLEDGTTSRRPQSLIYLPLISKDEVLGVITVQSFEKNAYTENDLNLLKTMAAYSSVAMDNANAYRKLNGTIDELRQMQQQLVQQEKMASLGQLTAGIAHEIKNPLNFVTNFADLNSEMATELREILVGGDAASIAAKHGEIEDLIASLQMNSKQIAKHGRRADSIVRGMMEHARPGDAEQFEVSLNGFVEEYINLSWHGYKARYPDLSVDIERDFDDRVGNAKVAPQEMGRVIINLVGNALDVVRDNENASLKVSTRKNGRSVEIRVADNGPGVPDDLRARIFEPFFTTKSTGEGTGLGLSMSHDIVTKGHGGQLRIEDTPGGGATFVVSIPG